MNTEEKLALLQQRVDRNHQHVLAVIATQRGIRDQMIAELRVTMQAYEVDAKAFQVGTRKAFDDVRMNLLAQEAAIRGDRERNRRVESELRGGLSEVRGALAELRHVVEKLQHGLDKLKQGLDKLKQGLDKLKQGMEQLFANHRETDERALAHYASLRQDLERLESALAEGQRTDVGHIQQMIRTLDAWLAASHQAQPDETLAELAAHQAARLDQLDERVKALEQGQGRPPAA